MADIKQISQKARELSDLLNQMITGNATANPEFVVASQVLDDALHEFTNRINKQ